MQEIEKKSYPFNQFYHSSWKFFTIKQNSEWKKKKKCPTFFCTCRMEQNLPQCSLNLWKDAQDSSLAEVFNLINVCSSLPVWVPSINQLSLTTKDGGSVVIVQAKVMVSHLCQICHWDYLTLTDNFSEHKLIPLELDPWK